MGKKLVFLFYFGFSYINLQGADIFFKDIDSYLNSVVDNNAKAMMEQLSVKMKDNELESEKALYEPVFVSTLSKTGQRVQSSPEDSYYSRLVGGEDYTSKSLTQSMGLTGLLPTGGTWDLSLTNALQKSNALTNVNTPQEDRFYVKTSFSQPLMKNFGEDITEIKIKTASINRDIAKIDYKKIMNDLVGVGVQAYWQLYGAKEIYNSWDEMVNITEKNLKTVQELVQIGRIAQTEAMVLENTLLLRKTELLNAKDKVTEIENQILTLLNVEKQNGEALKFNMSKNPKLNSEVYELESVFSVAVKNWDEFEKANERLKYATLQKKYLENQLLPELNFKVGGDIQNLDTELNDSVNGLNGEHYTWNTGFEMKIPLFGNQKMQKLLENAKLGVLKSQMEIDFLSKSLKNSLSTKIDKINNTNKQMEYFQKALASKKELLQYENEKMLKGKISARDLLKEEEKILEYEIKMYEKIVDMKISEAILDKTLGQFFTKYKLDSSRINF